MKKKILTENSVYYGEVSMPKNFEIDREKLSNDILEFHLIGKNFKFSKTWDMLNTYIRENYQLNFMNSLINMSSWGNIYKPGETSQPLLNVDLLDLKNSPDFILLYGVKVDNCWIKIYYDNNRRKGKAEEVELKNNNFLMFPATNKFIILNKQKESLNFIQNITYEYA